VLLSINRLVPEYLIALHLSLSLILASSIVERGMRETRLRSILKALSWRIVASLITGSIVFIFTHRGLLAFSVGVIDSIAKIIAYFFHERIWMLIGLGKVKHPLEFLELSRELTEEDREIIRGKLKELGYLDD
jgi:adenylylsulfate kinase